MTRLINAILNSKKLALMVFLGFLTPLSMWAQATGLIEEDSLYETLPLPTDYDGSKALDLPARVSLQSYCPMAGNQGQIQSCVGWSIGYAAYTIERAIQNRWTDARAITNEASSAMLVYNHIKQGKDCKTAQARMSDAMAWLTLNGNCLAKEFDNRTDDCEKKPDAKVKQSAKKYALAHSERVFQSDAPADKKINEIRRYLSKNKPVIVSIDITRAFMSLWNAEFWNPLVGDNAKMGGHAMVVVGYDDATSQFLLFNSWGTGWGKNGFIKVKYKDLAANCRYSYVIYLEKPQLRSLAFQKLDGSTPEPEEEEEEEEEEKKEKKAKKETKKVVETPPSVSEDPAVVPEYEMIELGGQLEFNQYKGRSASGEHIFEPALVDFKGDHYALRKNDWQVNQRFQLALTSSFSGAYVYVFSLNPKNEVKILFPRDENYNERFKGKHESPLIHFEGTRVVLPSTTQAIEIEHAGVDRICVLFSLKKIKNLMVVCDKLSQSNGEDFIKNLHKWLGSSMIARSDTNFEDEQVAFKAATRSGAVVLPIVIECRAQ